MIDNILPVLTFAGLLVGFASTIWGLFAKPTVEDEKGNKRLTSQGQVTVALAGFAFLISVSSFGFGLVLKQESAKKAAQDEIVELQKERLRDEKARLQEVRDLKQFALTEETLDETVNARFEQYRNELKRQADDARAARRISGENGRNLAGITSTLDGVGRLLTPVGRLSGSASWEIYLDGRSPLLRDQENCPAQIDDQDLRISVARTFRTPNLLLGNPESVDLFPDAELRRLLAGTQIEVGFARFNGDNLIGELGEELKVSWPIVYQFAFFYYCETDSIELVADFEGVVADFEGQGIKASLKGLEDAAIASSLRIGSQEESVAPFEARFAGAEIETGGLKFYADGEAEGSRSTLHGDGDRLFAGSYLKAVE